MAKITIPQNLKGKELFKFLVANKSGLIAQKKSLPQYAGAVSAIPEVFLIGKSGEAIKTDFGAPELLDVDTLRVKTVANTAWWMDSYRDVSIPDCWKKSIDEKKQWMKHLHDHIYTLDAEVGDVVDVQSVMISWKDLGIDLPGKTQCLVFITDIRKDYNEMVFKKYKSGKVKQHSIGLWYVKIELAVNDSEYKEEFAVWNKYIDKIANKSEAEDGGYFWALIEIKVIENSAVLFGANPITPTLGTEEKSLTDDTETEPDASTPDQPPSSNKSMLSKIGEGLKQDSMFTRIGKQFQNS